MNATRNIALAALALATLHFGAGPTPAPAVDFNGDGMSDVWQNLHGVTILDLDFDWDGDGANNYLESLYRTNPRLNGSPDPASDMFGICRVTVAGTVPTVHWPTQNGARYRLQQSSDLILWIDAAGPIEGNGLMTNQLLSPNPQTFGFYRVLPLDPGDLDGDGLDLWEERLLGYDPNVPLSDPAADTNNNGVHDDWEMYLFGDLTTVTALSDADGDGILDISEFSNHTNPLDLDTDNDGSSDGAETEAGTDPAVFDEMTDPAGPTGLEVFCPLALPLS